MAQPSKSVAKLADNADNPLIGNQQTAITAPPAGGTGAIAGAYDTAANRDLMITAINDIISVLEEHGLVASN